MLFQDFCSFCGSCNIKQILEPRESIYYARLQCSECGRFVKYVPKLTARQQIIDKLLKNRKVTHWENLFLRSVRNRKYLTHKQNEKFEQILERHQVAYPVRICDTG